MRALIPSAALLLVACAPEPEILGLLAPDEDCGYATDGALLDAPVLDLGPNTLSRVPYEATLLVEAAPGVRFVEGEVYLEDADGERLPDSDVGGEVFVYPNDDAERITPLEVTVGDEGRAAVPLTLVAPVESAALISTIGGDDFDLTVHVRLHPSAGPPTKPFETSIRLCRQCLVGVDAIFDGENFNCPAGPIVENDGVCLPGQDEVFSACE